MHTSFKNYFNIKISIKRENMKILYLFLIVCFFSCSKDEVSPDSIIYVQSITVNGSNITSGTTSQMTAVVLPENAANKSILWGVSDSSIAEISTSGLLSAKKNGSIIVTVTAKDKGIVKSTKEITISSFISGPNYDYVVSTTTELLSALSRVKAGETIFLNGGNYILNDKITLSKSGTSGNEITLIGPAEGVRPKLDFSSMAENSF